MHYFFGLSSKCRRVEGINENPIQGSITACSSILINGVFN